MLCFHFQLQFWMKKKFHKVKLKPKITENNDAEDCLVTKSYLLGRDIWILTCTALVLDSQRYLGLAKK